MIGSSLPTRELLGELHSPLRDDLFKAASNMVERIVAATPSIGEQIASRVKAHDEGDLEEKLHAWELCASSRALWRAATLEACKEVQAKAQMDTWACRHAEDRRDDFFETAVPDPDKLNFYICGKCDGSYHRHGIRKHVTSCTGKKRWAHGYEKCQHCLREFRNLRLHHCPLEGKPRQRVVGKKSAEAAVKAQCKRRLKPPLGGYYDAQASSSSTLPVPPAAPSRVGRRLRGKQVATTRWQVLTAKQWTWMPTAGAIRHQKKVALRPAKPKVSKRILKKPEGFRWAKWGQCVFCNGFFASINHRYQCPEAPWAVWVVGCEQRQNQGSTEEERKTWTHKCQYCGIFQRDYRPLTQHMAACRKRRIKSGLAV